jgi:hypothetical protein
VECALCLEDRKLCNSHIVPDFLFRRLREEERTFYVFSGDTEKRRAFRKTFSEKLLCTNCETHFSRWESYAAQFFSDRIPLTGGPEGRHLALSGVDYPLMKLFFMSLLWRFAVTTNPWFKGCDLGSHRERLRLLLLASNATLWPKPFFIRMISISSRGLDSAIGSTKQEAAVSLAHKHRLRCLVA